MDLNINDLENLSKFKRLIITENNKKNFVISDKSTAYLIINSIKHNSNKDIIKKSEKNIFYLSFANYNKNWYLKNFIRLQSFKKFKKFYKKKNYNNSLLISFFKLIYKSDQFEYSIKKYLIQKYEKFQELKFLIRLIKKKNKGLDVQLDLSLKILFSTFENKLNLNNFFNFNKIKKTLIAIFYPMIIIFNNRFVFCHKKKEYKNFFRIYKNGASVSNTGNLDWLVEDRTNLIFVMEDYIKFDSSHIENLKKKNYNYTSCNNINIGDLSCLTLLKLIFLITPLSLLIGIFIFFSKSYLVDFYFSSWVSFLKWKIFLKNFKGQNYVVYHNYQFDHIFRNILLNKEGIRTLHYKHTNSENIYNFNIDNGKHFINNDQLYLFYDYEFHQTKQSMLMAKANKSLSKNHLISGPTFITTKNLYNNSPLVSYDFVFYNSSLYNYMPLNIHKAHSDFLDLILNVSRNPNHKIIFKSKFDIKLYENYDDNLKQKIFDIKNRKNIDIISNDCNILKLICGDPITICMPFCTPFLISLGYKKKVFFVDFLNNFQNSFFSNYKNLVQKNSKDAINFIDTLKNTSKDNYTKNISSIYYDLFNSKKNIIEEKRLFKFLN